MNIITENSEKMVVRDLGLIWFAVGLMFVLVGVVGLVRPDVFDTRPALWMSILPIGVGLAVLIFCAKVTTVTFEKVGSKKLANYVWLSILGVRTHEQDLSSMKKIELVEKSGSKGGSTYYLAFVLPNDDTVGFLDPRSKESFSSSLYERKRDVGERVARFLGLPFEVRRPPTMKEMFSMMKQGIDMMHRVKSGDEESKKL